MIVLVSGGHGRHQGGSIGRLIVPGDGNKPSEGVPWAADNGAFSGFNETAFLKMLDRLEPWRETCLFVACPDVVGDSTATLDQFQEWAPRLTPWPLALVAQDGLTTDAVPWWRIDALFIGGTTEFKLSPEAAILVREANIRERWVHMGRVNTIRRMVYANSIGVDSIDGTSFSRWSDIYIPRAVRILPHRQLALEET
jgi:hypothetical protein